LSTATEATEFPPMDFSDDLIKELMMTEDFFQDELLQLYPLVDRIDEVVCSGAVCNAVLDQLVGFDEGGDGEEDGDDEEDGDSEEDGGDI